MPLKFVNYHGRGLPQCAAALARHEAEQPGAQVTVVVPRRGFSPPSAGTADQIADALSQMPDVAVTIIPPLRTVPESRGHSQPS